MLVFFNPNLGSSDVVHKRWLANRLKLINDQEIGCLTSDCNEIEIELTRNPKENSVLVIGGDGTLNKIVSFIMEKISSTRELNFFIIPAGGGNDLSRWLKLRHKGETIKLKPVSVKIDGIEYFSLNSCSIGFTAGALRVRSFLVKAIPALKGISYIIAVLLSLPKLMRTVCFSRDGKEIVTQVCIFMNGAFFGNGIKVVSEPSLEKSIFNVFQLKSDLGFFRVITALIKALIKGVETLDEVSHSASNEINLKLFEKTNVEIDGELTTASNSMLIKKMSRSIRIGLWEDDENPPNYED